MTAQGDLAPDAGIGANNVSGAWAAFHQRWARLRPPLRPDAATVAAMADALAGHDDHLLLLGVTPDLARLGRTMTAVDWSAQMIAHIWPGNGPDRRAVQADWKALPMPDEPYSGVVGDGSLSVLGWPHEHRAVMASLAKVMAPGARLVVRCYLRAEAPETAEALAAEVMAGLAGGIGAVKWRLAGLIAEQSGTPNVAVIDILTLFDRLFPDRDALAQATGWSAQDIADIDAYRTAGAVYSFTDRAELLAILPDAFGHARFVEAGDYELADRCPLLVVDRLA